MNTEPPVSYEQPYPVAQEHSKLGIASLIISAGTIVLYCLVIVILVAMVGSKVSTFQNQDPNEIARQMESGELNDVLVPMMLFVVCFFASPVLSIVGLGLGIGGLMQKDKQKAFSIVGTVLSSLLLCGSGGFVLLGVLNAFGRQ